MAVLSRVQLETIMPHSDSGKWVGPLNEAMEEWLINSAHRRAAFLAQIAHESADLNRLEENLNYSVRRLMQVWPKRFASEAIAQPYARNPQKLANRVYAGRLGNGDEASGDGWKYRGRGPIQLTGRSNYREGTRALGVDVARNPDRLLEPGIAARAAAWYWKSHGCNELADRKPGVEDDEDFVRITVMINGGRMGLKRRLAIWRTACRTLGA